MKRRVFLRASGVAIALPALASLMPKAAAVPGEGDCPKRFVAMFFPNGSTMRQDLTINGSGTNYTLGTGQVGLEPYKSKMSPFRYLNGAYGGAPDHSRGCAEFITGAPISNMTTAEVDISIDQAIADYLDPPTPIRSLHLGPTPYPGSPPSDTGWASGYNTFISWSSPTAPNAPLESAQVAFDQIYVPSGTDPGLAQKRLRLKQSVLDHTLDQIDSIEPRLGSEDSQKLDEYLTAIREVESGLQVEPPPGDCGNGAQDPGDGLSFPQHTQAMLDIIVLAFKCDATRIVTYSMDYGFGNKDFSFLGQGNGRHHNLSHSGTAQPVIDNHLAIVRWYMDQFAYFLGEMDAVDEGGPTLLDNSVVFFGSDMGDGWGHNHSDLPQIVAGGGGGSLNPGRLLDATGASYDSVLLALAHAMDAPLPDFSGANTPFSGL